MADESILVPADPAIAMAVAHVWALAYDTERKVGTLAGQARMDATAAAQKWVEVFAPPKIQEESCGS